MRNAMQLLRGVVIVSFLIIAPSSIRGVAPTGSDWYCAHYDYGEWADDYECTGCADWDACEGGWAPYAGACCNDDGCWVYDGVWSCGPS